MPSEVLLMLRKSLIITALLALAIGLTSSPVAMPRADAQVATFDAANFVKNSLNEVHLYYVQYQQAQQLQAQLQSLAQQIRSGALPTVSVWRNAQAELATLSAQVQQYKSISVGMDNINSQFAQYYPGCGECNQHYGYDQQVRTATMAGIQGSLNAAATSNQQFAEENLSLNTLKNAQQNGSQYAAIVAGNQISSMLVEQMQKERFNQTLLMQAEGSYYINEVQREADSDQAKSQSRAMWNYFLYGNGTDPEAGP
jgi:P-type conjugative transfer protein TrbJ